jgi:hypothetical protein
MYFILPMTKRGLWVSRVFDRNPKFISDSQVFDCGSDCLSNQLNKHRKDGDADSSPCATGVPNFV